MLQNIMRWDEIYTRQSRFFSLKEGKETFISLIAGLMRSSGGSCPTIAIGGGGTGADLK